MDSFELNKIAGAILGSLLVILGLAKITGLVYHPTKLEKNAFVVEGVVEEGEHAAAATAEAPAPEAPLPVLLAKADPAKGEKVSKQCASCHSFTEGGPNKTGPNLYDVVGKPLAHKDDFAYSDAFKAVHAAGKTWTYDALFTYLKDPKSYVPGNKMSFAGVKKDDQRADLIAYLKSISPDAPPFPAADTAAPEPAPTPAGEAAPH